jgi:hypothetical protein
MMEPMRQLERRRDALEAQSGILRRRIIVEGSGIAESLEPAERAVLAARRAMHSPLFVVGALTIALWVGPRRLANLVSRVAAGVAITRRVLSFARLGR